MHYTIGLTQVVMGEDSDTSESATEENRKEGSESVRSREDKNRDRDKDRDQDRGRDRNRDRARSWRDRGRDREREREREKEKERDRERMKERDRERERDRQRDKDRDRGRDDKIRDSDRDRDRDQDRGRDTKDRGRDRVKDRDRERGRERDTDGDKDHRRETDRDKSKERMTDERCERDRDRSKQPSSEGSRNRTDERGRDRDPERERERDVELSRRRSANDKDRQSRELSKSTAIDASSEERERRPVDSSKRNRSMERGSEKNKRILPQRSHYQSEDDVAEMSGTSSQRPAQRGYKPLLDRTASHYNHPVDGPMPPFAPFSFPGSQYLPNAQPPRLHAQGEAASSVSEGLQPYPSSKPVRPPPPPPMPPGFIPRGALTDAFGRDLRTSSDRDRAIAAPLESGSDRVDHETKEEVGNEDLNCNEGEAGDEGESSLADINLEVEWALSRVDIPISARLAGPDLFAKIQQLRQGSKGDDNEKGSVAPSADVVHVDVDDLLLSLTSTGTLATPRKGGGGSFSKDEEEEEDVAMAVEEDSHLLLDGGGDEDDLYGDLGGDAMPFDSEVTPSQANELFVQDSEPALREDNLEDELLSELRNGEASSSSSTSLGQARRPVPSLHQVPYLLQVTALPFL